MNAVHSFARPCPHYEVSASALLRRKSRTSALELARYLREGHVVDHKFAPRQTSASFPDTLGVTGDQRPRYIIRSREKARLDAVTEEEEAVNAVLRGRDSELRPYITSTMDNSGCAGPRYPTFGSTGTSTDRKVGSFWHWLSGEGRPERTPVWLGTPCTSSSATGESAPRASLLGSCFWLVASTHFSGRIDASNKVCCPGKVRDTVQMKSLYG